MSKIISFMRLDFYTLKPYRKILFIYILIGGLVGFITKSFNAVFCTFMIALIMLMTFPFSIGEKNGMDTLYSTLSLKRKNVVIGRYGFVVCMELIFIIFSSILSTVISKLFPLNINNQEIIFTLSVMSMVFSLIVSLQYPFYFKLGYNKAKAFAYIPLLIIFTAIGFLPNIIKSTSVTMYANSIWDSISTRPLILYGLPFTLGILFLALSCLVSCKFYIKRDI